MSAPNVEQVVPFLWVRDIQASLRFYVAGLGFVKTKEWVDEGTLRWCRLELGSAAVMLQEFWREGPHRNTPEGALGTGASLAFICKDARRRVRDHAGRASSRSRAA